MFPLNFNKNKAEYFIKCLAEGKSINPIDSPENWTINDMIGLAGACMFVISSHGPIIRNAAAEMQGKKLEPSDTTEHKEADDELVINDICGASQFVANLTYLVCDGLYDESFEELVQCGVTQKEQVEISVQAIAGFKNAPNQS